MSNCLHLGVELDRHASSRAGHPALMDRRRSFTFRETRDRVARLAGALAAMGLRRGDRLAVLMENSIEIVEVYLAAARLGIVAVPVNYLLSAGEAGNLIRHSGARVVIADDEFVPVIESVRSTLPALIPSGFVSMGSGRFEGYRRFSDLISEGVPADQVAISPEDPWFQIYTSGTTGKPKGVVRSHGSYVAFWEINGREFDFGPDDVVMNVMPLCHVNSTFYTLNVMQRGGSSYIHPARRFDAREALEVVQRAGITFISLVPTHYFQLLNIPLEERAQWNTGSLKKLLCSSAPVRRETKLGILDMFPGVRLFEAYGSTEAGLVTLLRPEEQMSKLGSIGREAWSTSPIRLLDAEGRDVAPGEVGEIWSKSPMLFTEYFADAERTRAAFRDGFFSASDMGWRDDEGYYYIADRKDNMVITGGEKVFPVEVEAVIGKWPEVAAVAVFATPDLKWGDVVTAMIVPREGARLEPDEARQRCAEALGKFKQPRRVLFGTEQDIPRSVTGKILHRELRRRFGTLEQWEGSNWVGPCALEDGHGA